MSQTLRPASDVDAGEWSPSSGSTLAPMVDEAVGAGDSTYITSPSGVGPKAITLALGAGVEPASGTVSVRVRMSQPPDGSDLSLDDIEYLGAARLDLDGFSYNSGQIAVRYVSGQRRLLMSKWNYQHAAYNAQANLCELTLPTLQSTTATAENCTIVREWANWHHLPTGEELTEQSNGWHVGPGMLWDEDQGVLWYLMFPEYLGNNGLNLPMLAATRLHDDGSVTKYGPWKYRTNAGSGSTGWRKVCKNIIQIPSELQANFGGRKVALFGYGMSSTPASSEVHWGPGGYAVHLPALDSTDPIEEGIAIADYSWTGGVEPPHCRRDADYTNHWPGALGEIIDGIGHWQSSIDMAHPAAWLAGSKRGLLLLGQLAHGDTWYGLYDRTADPVTGYSPGNPIGPDLMFPGQGSSSYHATEYRATAWIFEHDHLVERAAGTRLANSLGMQPTVIAEDWNTYWPNLGDRPWLWPYTTQQEGFAHDLTTNQLIWVRIVTRLYGCCALNPVIHVLQLPA